jgi:methionyl-tRNA synthetase
LAADTTFTWELFASAVNKDLADTLGNFVNRTLTFTARQFGTVVPDGGPTTEAERQLSTDLGEAADRYTGHLERLEFRKASLALREVWTLGNSYLEQTTPWLTIREDRDRAAATLRTAVNLIRIFAILAAPIIPATSERILTALGLSAPDAWISPDIAKELDTMRSPFRTSSSARSLTRTLPPGHKDSAVPQVQTSTDLHRTRFFVLHEIA